MKKILIVPIIFLVLIFLLFNLTGHLLLGTILEAAIGAPVSIGKFRLDLLGSEVGIYDIRIKNPKGFEEPILASVPEIFVHWDLSQIFKNRVRIPEIRLNLDQITVERNAEGAINLMEIETVKSGRKAAPSEKPKPAPGEQPAPPAVQIDQVILSLGRARYVDYQAPGGPLIREFSLNVRNSVLTNVTDPVQITRQIVWKTIQKVGLNALIPDWNQLSSSWGVQGASLLEGWVQTFKDKFRS